MEPWPCHSNTVTGVFFVKGEAMLDIKRIRTDFDTVAEKLATRGVDAAILNAEKRKYFQNQHHC